MQELSMQRAKTIYRAAVDSRVSDFEEPAWWEAVRIELEQVLRARTVSEAASVIAWWHHDWSAINDSPRGAAGRIRLAAKGGAQPAARAKRHADED